MAGRRRGGGKGCLLTIILIVCICYFFPQVLGTVLGTVGATAGKVPVVNTLSNYSCSALESLWENAGGPASAAFVAAEVARAESAGNPTAVDNDSNGSADYGLWQINSINGGGPGSFNPSTNASQAVGLYDQYGFKPWVTYNSGTEVGKC